MPICLCNGSSLTVPCHCLGLPSPCRQEREGGAPAGEARGVDLCRAAVPARLRLAGRVSRGVGGSFRLCGRLGAGFAAPAGKGWCGGCCTVGPVRKRAWAAGSCIGRRTITSFTLQQSVGCAGHDWPRCCRIPPYLALQVVCHLRSSTQWQRATPHSSPPQHAAQQQGEQLSGQDRLSTEDLEALEGQIVYELGGSGGTAPVPLPGGQAGTKFLGDEAAAGPAGDSVAADGFTIGGLQQLAAKLRNGSQTPQQQGLGHAAGGSGRYSSYEDSVDSKQSGPPGSAAPGRRGAAGSSGVAGEAGPGSGGRSRVPPLHLSRVSVADLLHASDELPAGASSSPAEQLQRVSKQAAASISRLAQSMHSSGMGAVTPGDIRAALSGDQLLMMSQAGYLGGCVASVSLAAHAVCTCPAACCTRSGSDGSICPLRRASHHWSCRRGQCCTCLCSPGRPCGGRRQRQRPCGSGRGGAQPGSSRSVLHPTRQPAGRASGASRRRLPQPWIARWLAHRRPWQWSGIGSLQCSACSRGEPVGAAAGAVAAVLARRVCRVRKRRCCCS